MNDEPDKRAGWAIGIAWANQIIALCMEMALPALAGFWLDNKLGTKFILLLVGLGLGITAGIYGLIRLTKNPP